MIIATAGRLPYVKPCVRYGVLHVLHDPRVGGWCENVEKIKDWRACVWYPVEV